MNKAYSEEEVLSWIWGAICGSTLRKTAASLGISASYLSDVMSKRRGISDNLASKFGFVKETTTKTVYRRTAARKKG